MTSAGRVVTLACIALFTDMLVYGLAIPLLPLLPATVAAGPAATGVLFAGYAAAMIMVTPIGSRLVDRLGPRRPLWGGALGLGAATALFSLAGPYWLLVGARVLQGIAAGLSWVAALTLIAAATPWSTRARSMGLAMSVVSIGVLIGPPLAGVLAQYLGVRAPFLFAMPLIVADGIACVALVRGPLTAVSDDPAGPLQVLRVRGSWPVIAIVTLGSGTIAAVEPVLPLHLTRNYGLKPGTLGLVFAVAVLTGAALSPVAGACTDRVGPRRLVGIGVLTAVVALAGLALTLPVWHVWASMAVLGASNAFLIAPATALIGYQGAQTTPPGSRRRLRAV